MFITHPGDTLQNFQGIALRTGHTPVIQDMGMEESVLNVYGTKINPIGNLLAVRAEYGALTFGSTNKKWVSLTDHYSEYVGARAKEHVNFIPLTGASRRNNFVNKQAL